MKQLKQPPSRIRYRLQQTFLPLSFLVVSSLSLAAEYDASEYEHLLSDANSKGFVRVLITLDDTVTLEDMESKRTSLKAALESKAHNVVTELGQNALSSGYWNNGLGQMGVYVNEAGLQVLAGSKIALAFTRDVTHVYRIKAADADGSFDAIENILLANGSANVEVFFNIDDVDYDIDRTGNTVYKPTSGMSAQAQAILDDIAKQPYTKGIKNLDNDFSSKPALKANIDRLAFYALAERDDIRAIRPVNFQDARMAQWPEEVLEAAKEHSDTEIIITLRGGEFFSPKTGYMPAAAIKAQEKAHQRAFDDILSKADLSADTNTSATTHLSLGILHGRFNFESLTKLYDAKDARILSIELNKPVAWTSLTNSTALMNLAPAWNAGYRAAGQSIVIIDSGVRKDHALFTTSGVSRVTFEACFGSNITASNGITYSSICPSQDASGDSSLGFPSSGEPNPNLAVCNTLATMPPPHTHDCSHGTHVAGIAAARKTNSVIPNTLQGVGPDASIISAQVFSYNNSVPSASAFNLDILAALIAVKNNTVVGLNNPFTINMSLGGNFYPNQSACPVTSINTAVTDLLSRGVPVIAATGNDYNKSSIASPACVPGIIKVSAVRNDSTGTTLSSFANIASQTLFPGGPFLFAPGGGDGTGVRSADRVSTTATKLMQGTSQAAPHVAGLYAAVKAANPGGVSVADVTAWIVTTGSIPVTINLPSIGNQTFRRVRAPN